MTIVKVLWLARGRPLGSRTEGARSPSIEGQKRSGREEPGRRRGPGERRALGSETNAERDPQLARRGVRKPVERCAEVRAERVVRAPHRLRGKWIERHELRR